jgi:hypothetical protein
MPNPIANPELYDSIVLGGMTSPGRVTLSGHDRGAKWDVKEGNGQEGASTTLKAIPPGTFKASFYLVDEEDFEAWDDFQDLIDSTISGPKPKALDIYHPDLARNGFTSVVKGKVYGAVHDGKGGLTIAVDFQEYKPAKPKGGSPSGSTATKKKDTAPDPNAARLAELARLTEEYKRTPWG